MLITLNLAAACTPVSVNYYRPAVPGGKVVSAFCPPVESIVVLEEQGVVVSVFAASSPANRIRVRIGFEVPEGKTAILSDHQLASLQGERVFDSQDLIGRVWISRARTDVFDAASPMEGSGARTLVLPRPPYSGATRNAYYWFNAEISVPQTEAFVLKLPDFSVNGSRAELPLVRFSRQEKEFVGTVTCPESEASGPRRPVRPVYTPR